MTVVFVLIVVTAMLMMLQRLVALIPRDTETPPHADPDGTGGNVALTRLRVAMQLLVTVLGLGGGSYVLLYGNFSAEIQLWAAGLTGSIFGFWLK